MADRPVALITGASMGIGEAFVDALAARGYDLVLVARSGAALEQIGARVSAAHGVRAISIAADLEDPAAVEHVATQTLGQFGRVDVLINNAGYGAHGRFETIDPARHSGQIALNIAALVDLTNRLAPGMLARGSGGIINVASIAGFQPVPYMAVYGATKAFVLSFSEALSEEFRGRGVRVLALCPGATRTNFFKRAGEGAQATPFRTSEAVVRTALRAYDRGASCVVDGRLNWLSSVSSRFVPRSAVLRIAARLMKPTTP